MAVLFVWKERVIMAKTELTIEARLNVSDETAAVAFYFGGTHGNKSD